MTETGVFATDRSSLLACADVLADWHRWADAARFAERAVPAADPDHAMRVEVAWWLLRAGRARDAAARLATVPDGAHPELMALRFAAAGLSEADKAPAMLRGLVTEVSAGSPTPTGLLLVMLLALAAKDRVTALHAAERHAALVSPLEPRVGALLAVHRALEDELDDAVRCTEYAVSGRIGEETAAIAEILRSTEARGDGVSAMRLLAEAFLSTGRDAYAELLLPRLPLRIRWRSRIVGIAVGAVVLGVGLAVTGWPALLLAGLVLLAGGALSAVWGAFASTPGLNRPQTNRLGGAYAQYRTRRGELDVLPAISGAAAAGFTATVLYAGTLPGATVHGALTVPALIAAAGVGVLLALAVAGIARWFRRRAQARVAADNRPAPRDVCHCAETDVLLGERWADYLAGHLDCTATEPALDAEWRRCPQTGRTWLHLPAATLALAVRVPG